jgi:hypothetical protein
MLDPVSAIGLASSIISFVDFSSKLIKGSYEVYKSTKGMTAEDAHNNTVLLDLLSVTEALKSNVKGESSHHKALRKLAADCVDASQELSDIMEELTATEGNRVWKSVEVKWKSMTKSKRVASIDQRLNAYRLQVILRLNLIMR